MMILPVRTGCSSGASTATAASGPGAAQQQDRQGRSSAPSVLQDDRHGAFEQECISALVPGSHGANMDFNRSSKA
jgi:hypothetical protein